MKLLAHRILSICVIGAVIFMVSSCSKSGGGSSGNSVSATVNGTAWSNNFPVIAFSTPNGGFSIVGAQYKAGDSTSVDVAFVAPFVLNQPISSDTSAFILAYTDIKNGIQTGYAVLTGGFGNAVYTVNSFDSSGHRISGTFSGVLYNISTFSDSVVITNGKFNTSYTVQ